MANFVADDKNSEGAHSFYTSLTNGSQYKYETAAAETVLTQYNLDPEELSAILELTVTKYNSVAEQEGKSVVITIPDGVKAGNKITINLPNGKTVTIIIPRGMRSGNQITINCELL